MAKSRKRETVSDLMGETEYREVLDRETPRGAVLVGAAYLDDLLGALLHAAFIADPISDEILDDRGGELSSLYVRTRLAYCMGLITKEEYADLNRIRNIRNYFAHTRNKGSFDDLEEKIACKHLITGTELPESIGWTLTNRGRFTAAVCQLGWYLGLRGCRIEHAVTTEQWELGLMMELPDD